MKQLLIILGTWSLLVVPVFAQGELYFFSNILGDRKFVYYPDCVTKVAGDAFRAQLYAAPAGSSEATLVPVPPAVAFLPESVAPGMWHATVVTVPFVPPGQRALVQVRVWETRAASYEAAVASGFLRGTSKAFELELASPQVGTPTVMIGLESFCLIPEPSPWITGLIGGALLFGLRRFR